MTSGTKETLGFIGFTFIWSLDVEGREGAVKLWSLFHYSWSERVLLAKIWDQVTIWFVVTIVWIVKKNFSYLNTEKRKLHD